MILSNLSLFLSSSGSSTLPSRSVALSREEDVGNDDNTDLVLITIYPDDKGRFGFNVKGGADQKMPIIVSRVGANTPADR